MSFGKAELYVCCEASEIVSSAASWEKAGLVRREKVVGLDVVQKSGFNESFKDFVCATG